MKEVNDQQKEMALKKKIYLLPVPALLLCLYLAACSSLVDTRSFGSALPDGLEPVTDMASLDGTWSIAGTTKLYFDSSGGYYIYRGCNGLGGRGEFSEVDGRPIIEFNGFLYDFLLRDDGSGMGLYLYEDGANAYLCPAADGNSFTLAGEYPGRYSGDEHFDGVFYRNDDVAAYTDLENAEFYYDSDAEICLWYHDGDGLIYPAGWIPEKIYDPDTATILENGSFLIFTPPDVSVPMFVDSAYDAVVYDKKIVELYALDDDGRGDLIPSERIPVLMGGALTFTNMQNLRTENNEDGTYRYEDFTQDGQILVVNTVEPTRFVPEVQDLEDYLTACAFALSDTDTYELLSAEENEEYTENLTYPVYIVTYTAGENEDTRKWTVFAMDTDRYTYLYGFCEAVDTEEDMDEIYQSIFSQLYLSDEN